MNPDQAATQASEAANMNMNTNDHDNMTSTSPVDQENDPLVASHSLIMSDDAKRVFEPPAHIAARFYRRPLNRRKSSAASSRRNSLSSTHSHTSSRSLRRASSQHHAIAQQLRRASILESRKARLADRAAHCEQVRLRAALLKSAPRGNGISSEEKALAAQLAREKYLAKVTAQCAEEVERAKQKAQDMKARKLEEERKNRQDMEDRLAEADKRRAEYQRNLHARRMRRASSQEKKLASVAEDIDIDKAGPAVVLDEDTAARRIQRTWRYRWRKAVVEGWMYSNITIEYMRLLSFEDVSRLITDDKILAATDRILTLFDLLSTPDGSSKSDTRSFLSAYLLLAHPVSVFGKLGQQENDLVAKAQELVVLFETAVCRLARWNRFYPSPTQTQELSQVYSTYTTAFTAWKARDSSTLIDTMIASFVELDAIWQTVQDDTLGNVADDYREGIRDNQVILLSRIRKLAGPDRADVLIKKAIRESRRRKGRRRTAAEVRPRVAESTSSETDAIATNESALDGVRQLSTSTETATTGPQSFSALFSPIPSNRVITHELAINKEYRVPTAKHSELRDQINRSLCDNMRDGIERGETATWTTAMAECIRGKLLGILKPGNSMHTLISEALESDHVYRQCTQGMFSYAKFFEFMASILPKLCAPFRDDQVKVLVEDLQNSTGDTTEMIEKLFRLLHFIDLLSLDYSNFLLMNAAPVLIREAAGYEQRMFAEDLQSGKITLANTTRWWRNCSVNALTEADRRDPEQIRLAIDRPTPTKIHIRGLVDLASSATVLEESAWPETLASDRERLLHIRRNFYRLVCIGASLLTTKNLMKRDVRAPWKPEASRLWDLTSKLSLESEDMAQQVSSVLLSSRSMPESSEKYLQAAVIRFCQQSSSGRLSDPVLKILAQRLRTHIFMRISASTSQERVRAASMASESLASAGLPEFVGHISDIVDIMGRLADVDFKAHGAWYEQIAQETQNAGDA
ncbi:hypothetical protein B9Z65_8635 [Elsinoe australis]|uniref:Uncharacterized protein n=1 Tax=Elsinoe australis TaxID=40998 RepID=A0A2P7YEC3_9PEZI|nr:hypothetical protein B9Z65_8635 [Elsinoe australis]